MNNYQDHYADSYIIQICGVHEVYPVKRRIFYNFYLNFGICVHDSLGDNSTSSFMSWCVNKSLGNGCACLLLILMVMPWISQKSWQRTSLASQSRSGYTCRDWDVNNVAGIQIIVNSGKGSKSSKTT